MKTKKFLALLLAGTMALWLLAGCGNGSEGGKESDSGSSGASEAAAESVEETVAENGSKDNGTESGSKSDAAEAAADGGSEFDASSEIGVIAREDGSGTRGAFIELFGIEQKDESGEKVDYTVDTAEVTNSTSVMMTTVAGDLYSIGYISLGSMNGTVKGVRIDGVEPTVEEIKSGAYKVARPFNIAVKEGLSEMAQDFIDFIMSADGQAVIEENGYIPVSDAGAYGGRMDSGRIVVSGSSSITPVMEKLREAYLERNPNVEIEVQQSDSSTGMADAIDGTCDIGMASRELKDSEMEKGLTPMVIAMDGIVVIVNNDSPVEELTSEQVKEIYMGDATLWSEVQQ